MLHEPSDDDGPAALLLHGSTPGSGLSLQVVYSLLPDSDELLVEARVFNRTLDSLPLRPVVCFSGLGGSDGFCGHDILPDCFIAPRDSVAFPFRIGTEDVEVPTSTYGSVQDTWRDPAAPVESLPIHLRGAAHIRLANAAALVHDFASALDHVDSALATLADDPLAWWQRAVLARLNGEDNDQELTTAHALSPLEPALRAEAFLAMPQTHSKEPSAVLKGFSPDDFHETVHLLIEAGLYQEATRLMDEAQRHQEHPLLRYMHAWCLMQTTRMEVEASFEVQKAGKAPIAPPFPWRPLEERAVRELAERFSKDERLRALVGLLDKRSGPAT
jgi:hypothetical protein